MRAHTFALARRLAPLSALALLAALALAFSLATPRALAAGGTGTIAGVVQNGTHGSAPVAGQQVTLQLTIGSTTKDVATQTTDAQGRFSFAGLDVATSDLGGSYAVYTRFQGGVFADGPINLATGPTQTAQLMVYDATQDSSALSVSVATILIRKPDVTHGLIGVGEFLTIRNSGTTAFVGSLPSTSTGGKMPSLLRFSLPPAAQNVTTGVGFFNTDAIQIGTGFAAAATVPPGQTEFAFAYDLPYTGATLNIPYKAEYPTDQVVTLVPPDLRAHGASGVTAQGIVTAFGSRYQVYTANNVALNGQTAVNLVDLPLPGEPQDLNVSHLFWLGGGLALLLALLLALYLWRGALAVTLGLVPAAALVAAPASAAADGTSHAIERERLLRDLLALERRRAAGDVTEEQFKREDADLRGRLRTLLAEAPAATVDAAVKSGVTSEVAASVDASATPGGGKR